MMKTVELSEQEWNIVLQCMLDVNAPMRVTASVFQKIRDQIAAKPEQADERNDQP